MLGIPTLILCAICLFATAILVNFAVPMCTNLRLMDLPDNRKKHVKETPLFGGLIICLVAAPILFLASFVAVESGHLSTLITLIVATLVIAVVGMADDRHSLSATSRIVLTALTFAFAAMLDPMFNVRVLEFAVGSQHLKLGLATSWLAILFTTLCCVGLVNSINMADGKNGLVIGLCIGWLLLVASRAPDYLLPIIFILLTALGVLFVSNMQGKIFLGDGGSYGFGAAIALVTIAVYNTIDSDLQRSMNAEEVMLLFAVPVLDSFRLTFSRLRRGQSPMTADRDHLHHHLQDRMGWPGGLIVYWLLAFIPCIIVLIF